MGRAMKGDQSTQLNGLSYAKALGCVFVIMEHSASHYFDAVGSDWDFINIIESLTRVAVPLFIMATGAIFLAREDSASYFYGKRMIRICLPLVFWSLMYLAWGEYNGREAGNWAHAILAGPVVYHLWYLYGIIGLSLVTPILSSWFRQAKERERWATVVVWVVLTTILPTFSAFVAPLYGAPFPATGYTILDLGGYMIFGATISAHTGGGKLCARTGWLLYVFGTLATFVLTKVYSSHLHAHSQVFYYYNSAFVILAAGGLFAALSSLRKISRWVTALSASS